MKFKMSPFEPNFSRLPVILIEPFIKLLLQDERAGSSGGGQNTVSLIVGGKTLYLFNLYDPENPIELAFQVCNVKCLVSSQILI